MSELALPDGPAAASGAERRFWSANQQAVLEAAEDLARQQRAYDARRERERLLGMPDENSLTAAQMRADVQKLKALRAKAGQFDGGVPANVIETHRATGAKFLESHEVDMGMLLPGVFQSMGIQAYALNSCLLAEAHEAVRNEWNSLEPLVNYDDGRVPMLRPPEHYWVDMIGDPSVHDYINDASRQLLAERVGLRTNDDLATVRRMLVLASLDAPAKHALENLGATEDDVVRWAHQMQPTQPAAARNSVMDEMATRFPLLTDEEVAHAYAKHTPEQRAKVDRNYRAKAARQAIVDLVTDESRGNVALLRIPLFQLPPTFWPQPEQVPVLRGQYGKLTLLRLLVPMRRFTPESGLWLFQAIYLFLLGRVGASHSDKAPLFLPQGTDESALVLETFIMGDVHGVYTIAARWARRAEYEARNPPGDVMMDLKATDAEMVMMQSRVDAAVLAQEKSWQARADK